MTQGNQRGGIRSRGASQLDVARLAGVSPQTVSRVANGSDSVLPQTKARVEKAMSELGYVPNAAARALRYGRHRMIGVLSSHVDRTGEARMLEAVLEAAQDQNLDVMLVRVPSTEEHHGEAYNQQLLRTANSVDGFVALGMEIVDGQTLRLPVPIPLVIAGHCTGEFSSVGCDQVAGCRAAVEHLLRLGHSTVHFLAGPSTSIQAQIRHDAWRQTLLDHGCDVPTVVQGDWSSASGYLAAEQLLADPMVSAVFCANDDMAAGLLRALHEHGTAVPDQISVIGFDDVQANYLWPSLTTVRQDFRGIGKALMDELVARMDNPEQDHPPRHVMVDTPLLVRHSTASPAAQ